MFESHTLYKLIILYMLENASSPLSNAQISDLILEQGYTDYFTLQQAIVDLTEGSLIKIEATKNSEFYHITQKGRETLNFFKDKISPAIMNDINIYLEKNKLQIINAASIITDYYKSTNSGYIANCKVREKDNILLELNISVDSKEHAERVCTNWKANSDAIYSYLIGTLLN